ncbi:heterokaryon incompatibility protein-domain-containing protein [Cladorrhinum sp. PSN332]|nr:heterokaryon incompatibility protein-domain-containing protein [Cladorrhinum sp. PSN332]
MPTPEPPHPNTLSVIPTSDHAAIRCSELLKPSSVKPTSVYDSLGRREWVLDYPQWQVLQTTAAAGCPECGLIVGIVKSITTDVATMKSINLEIDRGLLNVRVWESTTADESSGGKAVWGVPVFWPRAVRETPWPTVAVETAPVTAPEPPSFASAVLQLRVWITECDKTHTCVERQDVPDLPTRIIDVGTSAVNPRLHVTKRGEKSRYAALSHCWGLPGAQHLTTTSKSLSSHCEKIPFDSFPLTFQDAIKVTRAMGLKYLWIDCVCILQDSPNDWAQESSRMADLYTNAYVTLAADFATDATSGLFVKDPSLWPQLRHLSQNDASGNTHQIFLRQETPTVLRGDSDPKTWRSCYREEAVSSLKSRGWVLQEQALSRRVVHFTNAELIWECRERGTCSCGIPVLRGSAKGLVDRMLKSPKVGTANREMMWAWFCWYSLVEEFTKRRLTYVKDRLPAFTGIATLFPIPASEYLAGLWRSNLDNLLLWQNLAGNLIKRDSPDCLHRKDSFRIQGRYAPTWSWASVSGTVSYPAIFGTFDRDDDSELPDWKILEAKATPSTPNPYGPVNDSLLRIEGRLLPVGLGLWECPEHLGGEKDHCKKAMTIGVYPTKDKGQGASGGYFCLSSMDAGIAAGEWNDSENYEYVFLLAGFNVYKSSNRNRQERTAGLILRRLKDNPDNTYSRIGICHPMGRLWVQFDWNMVDRRVVTII